MLLTGEVLSELEHMVVFPASHYVVDKEAMERAIRDIEAELEEQSDGISGLRISFWRHRGFLNGLILISK